MNQVVFIHEQAAELPTGMCALHALPVSYMKLFGPDPIHLILESKLILSG